MNPETKNVVTLKMIFYNPQPINKMALSKNKIRYIHALKDKKFRNRHHTFVAEGRKLVSDLSENCKCELIAATSETIIDYGHLNCELIVATEEELRKASSLKTAPTVIGVFFQPQNEFIETEIRNGLHLVLDGIQDPGNMGTIVRLADWFGIEHIFCSPDTADIYNPKTVQASMGALARIKTYYTDINDLFVKYAEMPIYGTFLEGKNIYCAELSSNGFIVMGNEGSGISKAIEKHINEKLFIPNFPPQRETSESLNVASATAIVCSEFRRRQ